MPLEMPRIRAKMSPEAKKWTCCFGLHVRTATVIIGLWHLFLNLALLGLIAIIIRNPQMMQIEGDYEYTYTPVDLDAPPLPTPLSKIEPPYGYRDRTLNYQSLDMGGLACVCMIGITLFMVYGAVKGKPCHLLPFYCIQLFDFAITVLTAAGYVCYLRSVHRIVSDSPRLPFRDYLLALSPSTLTCVLLFAFAFTVILKAYVIGIVWHCYKYLVMRQHTMRSMLPYIIPDVAPRQERDYNTLLPDYEEAISQSLKQQPPPSYSVAMATTSPPMGATLESGLAAHHTATATGVTVVLPPVNEMPSANRVAVNAATNNAATHT